MPREDKIHPSWRNDKDNDSVLPEAPVSAVIRQSVWRDLHMGITTLTLQEWRGQTPHILMIRLLQEDLPLNPKKYDAPLPGLL